MTVIAGRADKAGFQDGDGEVATFCNIYDIAVGEQCVYVVDENNAPVRVVVLPSQPPREPVAAEPVARANRCSQCAVS
jgi:hypothetical protein